MGQVIHKIDEGRELEQKLLARLASGNSASVYFYLPKPYLVFVDYAKDPTEDDYRQVGDWFDYSPETAFARGEASV